MYGLVWWIKLLKVGSRRIPAFFAHGSGGQSIWIFEDLDLVVVFTAGYFAKSEPVLKWLQKYELPAVAA